DPLVERGRVAADAIDAGSEALDKVRSSVDHHLADVDVRVRDDAPLAGDGQHSRGGGDVAVEVDVRADEVRALEVGILWGRRVESVGDRDRGRGGVVISLYQGKRRHGPALVDVPNGRGTADRSPVEEDRAAGALRDGDLVDPEEGRAVVRDGDAHVA